MIVDHTLCTDTASGIAETSGRHHTNHPGNTIGWLRKQALYYNSTLEYLLR